METTQGEIVVELFENEAPETVGNFVYLVKRGFYDELPFHDVQSGFMAQTGCPHGDGTGGPGYTIYDEFNKSGARKHFRGVLSMANRDVPDSGDSQFFITFRPAPRLDGRHTVFGRVIEGMDVVTRLQRRTPQDPQPAEPDRILEAKVLRDRGHEYLPNKVQ
ncbi:MAG: peptidylprolyl isomerase [Planctomycetota bacterium]